MKRRATKASHSIQQELKPRKRAPYQFVIDALESLSPWTRSMFGCTAVYVGEKIVICLRDKPTSPVDNGVWLATDCDHHESLRLHFPNMRSIAVLGKPVTGWQILPADAPDFEESALRACELIAQRDPRIGKLPASKQRKRPSRPTSRTRTK